MQMADYERGRPRAARGKFPYQHKTMAEIMAFEADRRAYNRAWYAANRKKP